MIIGTHKTDVGVHKCGVTFVKYHKTNVVTIDQDRNYATLDNGGYLTNTTKKRMNQASKQFGLGFKVFQKNFEWFIRIGDTVASYGSNNLCTINLRAGKVTPLKLKMLA